MDSRVRQERNLAEKQRRDKLNGYINELASLVPMVSMSNKRLDKISVLRLSAAYLRLNQTNAGCSKARTKLSQKCKWRPSQFTFNHLKNLLDSIEGFIVVTTCHGKIIYVSHSVEKFLGHQNIEMIGYSLTSFLHPSDSESVYSQIQSLYEQIIEGRTSSDTISFRCRLRERNQPRSEVVTYQMVNVTGHMHLMTGGRSDAISNDSSGMKILFKGFVQIIATNPMAELSLLDANLDEYVSRHLLDGTLLFADHRIANITGHLPQEVIGRNAYEYILPDDHSIALFAHKLMLSNSNGTGIVVHRLRTSGGSYVFLQSAGCLQYDRSTGQVDHWVCISRLLVEDEGDKERDKFVKRFTPHISNVSPTALYESLQIVIGPKGSKTPYSGILDPFSQRDLKPGTSSGKVKIEELAPTPTPSPQPFLAFQNPLTCSISTIDVQVPETEVQNLSPAVGIEQVQQQHFQHPQQQQPLEYQNEFQHQQLLHQLQPQQLQASPTIQIQTPTLLTQQKVVLVPQNLLTSALHLNVV